MGGCSTFGVLVVVPKEKKERNPQGGKRATHLPSAQLLSNGWTWNSAWKRKIENRWEVKWLLVEGMADWQEP